MPDPVTLAISLGVGALVLAREVVSFVRERDKGAPREAHLPVPTPSESSPRQAMASAQDLEVAALRAEVMGQGKAIEAMGRRVETVETRVAAALRDAEVSLARVETKIDERTTKGGGAKRDGGQRESR